jgi:hypothetical protein
LAEYRNPAHYNDTAFQWDPAHQVFSGGIAETSPGYLPMLMQYRDRVRAGTAKDYEAEQYRKWEAEARAIPTRDIASLTSGWQGDLQGQWTDSGWQEGAQDWWSRLDPLSPDVGPIVLGIRDRIDAGTASPQKRQLFQGVMSMASDWDWRASTPQASDAFSPLGDNLLSALGVLGLGATGGLAAAPLFAGGAGLATTLGSLGSLAGVAGTGAGVLGQATDQPWLSQLGLGLGIAGGLAGGLGGLSSLWGSGVNSLSDAAKLAQSAGKITGSLGRIPGADPLKDVSRYLGYAGQAGQLGAGIGADDWLGWSGDNAPSAANVAPNVQNLLSAADMATQRGGGNVADFSYEDFIGWGDPNVGDPWNSPMPADTPGWEAFTGWGGDETQTGWYQNADLDTSGGGGNWLQTILGGLGGAGKLLAGGGGAGAGGAGLLGPLLSSLGSVGGGAIGSNAANEAARLQAATANRGLDIQQAMWLQNLERQQPWLEAGHGALSQLTNLSGQQAPAFNQPGMPGTQPFQYNGPGMPGQGFQYTGAGMPATGFQYSGPGMPATGFQYTNQMPTQDFKAPTWDELQARDPGIQARLAEAQKAIETSAAARGMTMSGSTLGALQRQSQTLAANEYAPAYQRALGEYQQEYGQDWQRQQEAYARALTGNQLEYGREYQQQGDIYGRQLAENQQLYNRQWQQQDTDYARQLAQNQLLYGRGMEQYKQGYGEQAGLNQQDYARNQALYGQQYQQMMDQYNAQLAQQTQQWNRLASLSGTGQTAVNQLGTGGQNNATQMASLLSQLGNAQAGGTLGGAQGWISALGNVGNSIQGGLQNASLMSALANLNR